MVFLRKFLAIFFCLAFVASAEFKAGVDADYEEKSKYGFGSLMKNKSSFLKNLFNKNDSEKNSLKIKKASYSPEEKETAFEKTWNALAKVLSEFPIEYVDKSAGEAKTELVKIESFDVLGVCKYRLSFKVKPDGSFSVDIKSKEDSELRLGKLTEIIENRIKKYMAKS